MGQRFCGATTLCVVLLLAAVRTAGAAVISDNMGDSNSFNASSFYDIAGSATAQPIIMAERFVPREPGYRLSAIELPLQHEVNGINVGGPIVYVDVYYRDTSGLPGTLLETSSAVV